MLEGLLESVAEGIPEHAAAPVRAPKSEPPVKKKRLSAVDAAAEARIEKMFHISAARLENEHVSYHTSNIKDTIAKLRFMENFEDEYEDDVEFSLPIDSLDKLTISQLRSYFSYRTRARRGNLSTRYPGQAFLYLLELCNNIGVRNPKDGARKLVDLRNALIEYMSGLDRYFIPFIKGYYICNPFKESFSEFVDQYGLSELFPEAHCERNTLGYYSKLYDELSYSPQEKRFINRNSYARQAIREGFCCVMRNLEPLFEAHGVDLVELVVSDACNQRYIPFPGIAYDMQTEYERTEIIINPFERYEFKNGLWCTVSCDMYFTAKPLLTMIAKNVEKAIYENAGYSGVSPRAYVKPESLYSVYITKLPILSIYEDERFDEIVSDATKLYLRNTRKLKLIVPFNSDELICSRASETARENAIEPRATFVRMRKLPHSESSEEQSLRFYRQAKLTENLACEPIDFDKTAPSRIGYDFLDDRKLQGYFAWRASYRSGEVSAAPGWCALLYAAELMHGVGAANPLDTMGRLARVLIDYPDIDRKSKNRIVSWLRDYYISHANTNPEKKSGRKRADKQAADQPPEPEKTDMFDRPFLHYLQDWKILPLYPELLIGSERECAQDQRPIEPDALFEIYAWNSTYKIEQSRFYYGTLARLTRVCFARTLSAIYKLFDDNKISFADLLLTSKAGERWVPFQDAPCYAPAVRARLENQDSPAKMRRFSLNIDIYRKKDALEVFRYRGTGWGCVRTASMRQYASAIIGYILRTMEISLRKATGFKYKLAALPPVFDTIDASLRRAGVSDGIIKTLRELPLDGVIEQAAADTISALYPGGFSAPEIAPTVSRVKADPDAQPIASVRVSVDLSALDRVRGEADQVFDKLTAGIASEPEPAHIQPLSISPSSAAFEADDGGEEFEESWTGLAAALSALQKQALRLLTEGGEASAIRELLNKSSAMPEPFFESINALSLMYVGDTLVESTGSSFELVDAYSQEVQSIIA
jgi:hypothetical protein